MSDVVKHKTQSAKTDAGDPTDVQPSWWNEEHEFTGGTDGQILVRDSAETDGARWADPSSDWDQTITKSVDQTVTNSATLTNDTELVVALAANAVYVAEFFVIYSGNDIGGDYKWQFTGPWGMAQQATGFYYSLGPTLTQVFLGSLGAVGAWPPSSGVTTGTDAAHTQFVVHGRLVMVTNAAANLQYQFSQNSAIAAKEAKTYAGSTLRIKRLA
jgi:hypothetical protein